MSDKLTWRENDTRQAHHGFSLMGGMHLFTISYGLKHGEGWVLKTGLPVRKVYQDKPVASDKPVEELKQEAERFLERYIKTLNCEV